MIGVPDEDWGRRVHAVIQSRDPVPAAYRRDGRALPRAPGIVQVPKSYEFVPLLPRDDAGKIRRSALVAEREAAWTEGMVRPHLIPTPG